MVVFGGRDFGRWVKFAFLHVTLTVPKLSREQMQFGFFEQSLANFYKEFIHIMQIKKTWSIKRNSI